MRYCEYFCQPTHHPTTLLGATVFFFANLSTDWKLTTSCVRMGPIGMLCLTLYCCIIEFPANYMPLQGFISTKTIFVCWNSIMRGGWQWMFKAAQYGKRSSQVNHSTKEGEWNTLGEYFFTADFCGYHTFFLDRFSGKCPNPFLLLRTAQYGSGSSRSRHSP